MSLSVGVSVPKALSLVDILSWRAAHQPGRLAYTFLSGPAQQEFSLTYAELDFRVRAVANALQEAGASGQRVLVLCPSGLDFVVGLFACMYAGAVAVPAYPPQAFQINQTLPRLRAIIRDCEPIIGLVTADVLAHIERLLPAVDELRNVRWMNSPDAAGNKEGQWHRPDITRDTLGLLQYTSGSTAMPKGVMLSHGNLLSNSEEICGCFSPDHETRLVTWLPPYHDMGLGGLVAPLYAGVPVYMMSPLSFLQHPLRWLKAISKYRATVSGAPNFAYRLCASRIRPEEINDLDLSSWKLAFNGSEPVHSGTLEQFAATFSRAGFGLDSFLPCYGLAEATLFVTGIRRGGVRLISVSRTELQNNRVRRVDAARDDAATLVGCGQVDQEVAIVSPDSLTRCEPGEIGEIWARGESIGRGYWKQPEATEIAFRGFISGSGDGPFLRTGDLGTVIDRELFITGRLKDLIIVAGRNHYPQDIELTVEQCHASLRPGSCAAFAIKVDGQERLVIAAELDRRSRSEAAAADVQHAEVLRAIKRAVAETHDVQVHEAVLLKAGSIPRTSSGKLQRNACRAAFLSGILEATQSTV